MSKKLEAKANNYMDIVSTALQADTEPEEKKRRGRPTKQDAVKRTDHRLSVYINNDLYDFWTEQNKKVNGNMAGLINRLLYEEMERTKRNG